MGLKTLGQSFKNPKAYYQAALSANWDNKFTPSFRLWLSIITITFFFQFFWAGAGTSQMAAFTVQSETIFEVMANAEVTIPNNITPEIFATKLAKWY